MKNKVLIPTKLDAIARDLLTKNGSYEVVQDDKTELKQFVSQHTDAHALIVRSEEITAAIIDLLPSLKVIIRAGAGYNTIDTKYARKKGIDVLTTPGANANAVAEEVVALMLADARQILQADPSVRAGKWDKKQFMGREVAGKTIGIAGLGYVGRTLAKRLAGFEVKLLGYDPLVSKERAEELNIEMIDLAELFKKSDYVSLHMPENSETKGVINYSLLSLMKKGATLINCARAGIINEDDLRRARQEKQIRFLNDVYPKDEAGPKTVADVADIMMPHLGATTIEANTTAARRAAEELIEYDEKGVLTYVVNRDIPAGLDEAYCNLAFTMTRLCRAVVGKELQLKLIETSFYGDLEPYAQWLVSPIVSALNENFDRSSNFRAAVNFLKDKGIDYIDRKIDDRKGYRNSITIDLTGNDKNSQLRHASIRGTVTEGHLMISRIDDFDKLYFEPKGPTAIFTYKDRPGVLGQIGAALAKAGINIDDVRNPHDSRGAASIAILKINKTVPADVLNGIAQQIAADIATSVEL